MICLMDEACLLSALLALTSCPCPTLRGFGTERSRLGTFSGFCTERARLGTFRDLGTERARLGTFNQNLRFPTFSKRSQKNVIFLLKKSIQPRRK